MQPTIDQFKLWNYIPLDQFKKPATSIDESIKKGYNKLIKKIFPESKPKEFHAIDGLKQLPVKKLNLTTPNPDWSQAVESLDSLLNLWKLDKDERKIIFVVGQPVSENDEILGKWATKNNIAIPPEPKMDQIFDSKIWFSENSALLKESFVITRLENYFLKHHRGLNLIRGLFDRIDKQGLKCVIGLNSWAWSYLNEIKILSHEVSNNVYIAEAFDDVKFKIWLQELTKLSTKRKFIYRKTNDGSYLIYPSSDPQDANKSNAMKFDEKFFRNLCSYSFGVPSIALQIWKNSLRATPDDEFFKKEESEGEEGEEKELVDKTISTIWVLPWDKISKPTLTTKPTNIELVILNLVLLHSELTFSKIGYLLGETFTDHSVYLKKLINLGLIIKENSLYTLNPIAYNEISQLLKNEGYLTDNLV